MKKGFKGSIGSTSNYWKGKLWVWKAFTCLDSETKYEIDCQCCWQRVGVQFYCRNSRLRDAPKQRGSKRRREGRIEVLISYPLKNQKSPPEVLIMYQKLTGFAAADAKDLMKTELRAMVLLNMKMMEMMRHNEGYCGDNPQKAHSSPQCLPELGQSFMASLLWVIDCVVKLFTEAVAASWSYFLLRKSAP
eukprot:gene3982-18324_t